MPQSGRRIFYGPRNGRAGDHRGAAEAFAAAVRLMPDVVEARLNLASALMNSGRDGDALREFEAVLARQPERNRAAECGQAARPCWRKLV